MFGPADRGFEIAALAAAGVVPLTTLVVWTRLRGRGWLRLLQRAALILACQVVAVVAVFAVVNQANEFYVTWAELAGITDAAPASIEAAPPASTPPTAAVTPSVPAPTSVTSPTTGPPFARDTFGLLTTAGWTGPVSHVTGAVHVWTPPGYDPATGPALPVILLLPGFPGAADTVFAGLDVQKHAGALITSGAMKPVLIVSADTAIGGKDWGCADVPGGPAVTTWLAQDVRTLITEHFHVLGGAHRWATLGLSAGGSCAVRLALTRPTVFAAAASLSGFNVPDSPALTRTSAAVHANDLRTLAAAGTSQPVDLLLAVSQQDPGTVTDGTALKSAAGPGVSASLEVLAHGGHNWQTWQRMADPALTWLGQHLAP